MVRLDAEPTHEFLRFADARFGRLVLTEHNLQLKEVTQAFHSVEVNASAADEKSVRCLTTRPAWPYARESDSRRTFGVDVEERR